MPTHDLTTTQQALERLAYGLSPAPPTRPATADHIIIASRRNIEGKFGRAGFERVDAALRPLAQATQAALVYADDPLSAGLHGIDPARPDRADDWRAAMFALGGQSASLLLVGGPDLVPMPRVFNPSDDDDGPLPSDAPFAGTYLLAPAHAVGRLPDADNLDFLVDLVQSATEAHAAARRGGLDWRAALRRTQTTGTAIGYTASIWRHAARAVFAALDTPQRLRMSPPLDHRQAPVLDSDVFAPAYFNLHGLRDTAGWYGQRDPLLAADYPAFPLALQPDQLAPAPRRRRIVLSAACYGAYIEGKSEADSLALSFLATQAVAFIGSTALAYGGLSEPLQATDQLALLFWQGLRAGLSVGEALRQAKLGLAEELKRRQGYLDAEDQKAILTFTLLGDPTLIPFPKRARRRAEEQGSRGKGERRSESSSSEVARQRLSGSPRARVPAEVSEATRQRVERAVREQLPDLGRVEIRAVAPPSAKSLQEATPALTVTVAETAGAQPFRHLVKVTLAPDGGIEKLVMAHGWGRVLG